MPRVRKKWLCPYTQEILKRARQEHAVLLKCEGLTHREIGKRFGVGRQRAYQLVRFGGHSLAWGMRRCKFKLLTSNQKDTSNEETQTSLMAHADAQGE